MRRPLLLVLLLALVCGGLVSAPSAQAVTALSTCKVRTQIGLMQRWDADSPTRCFSGWRADSGSATLSVRTSPTFTGDVQALICEPWRVGYCQSRKWSISAGQTPKTRQVWLFRPPPGGYGALIVHTGPTILIQEGDNGGCLLPLQGQCPPLLQRGPMKHTWLVLTQGDVTVTLSRP